MIKDMRTRNPAVAAPGLVGRRAEIDLLDETLDDARLGRARAVVLRGEAGIGKTALLEQAGAPAGGLPGLRCARFGIVGQIDHPPPFRGPPPPPAPPHPL